MSTPAPASLSLDGLDLTTEARDHKAFGIHHRHVATASSLVALAERFRAAGYILEMVSGEDRRGDLGSLRVAYTFNRIPGLLGATGPVERHLVVVAVELGGTLPSLCGVYRAANWMEREVFDMYGVRFADHPQLERILLPDDADFHALLKDFGKMEPASGEGEGE